MMYMKVEQQLNIPNRTLLLGIPQHKIIPDLFRVDGKEFKVVGVSSGVKSPFISLEIEKTSVNLVGKSIEV